MTEGIIQRVLKRFSNNDGIRFNGDDFILIPTEYLQKELIEEIKKGITTDFLILNIGHSLIAQHTAEDIRKRLIGDNQE